MIPVVNRPLVNISCVIYVTVLCCHYGSSACDNEHQVSLSSEDNFTIALKGPNECRKYTVKFRNDSVNRTLVKQDQVITDGGGRVTFKCQAIADNEKYCLFTLKKVRPDDAGFYYVNDDATDVINGTFLNVTFAPIITIDKMYDSSENFLIYECSVKANPLPSVIRWLYYSNDGNSTEFTVSPWTTAVDETTKVPILISILNCSHDCDCNSNAGNIMCIAVNSIGSNNVTISSGRRHNSNGFQHPIRSFNITGFIIGMIPPMFISFYIIVHLSFKSRYAEERPEEDGMDPAIFGDPYHSLYRH
ncbi:Uncharacterised protein g10796 [Pycnogonum litorale]